MKKRNVFDILENSGEGEIEMIDRLTPELSDEQFERILEMSKRKRNIMRAAEERNINMNTNYNMDGDVTGVEEYKRPIITKMLAAAASLVILGGGIALGHNMLKRSHPEKPNIVPNVAATTVTATTVTTDSENADITTVTADVTAEVSGTVTVPAAVSGETSAASSTQNSTSAHVTSQAQAVTTIAENTAEEPVVTENPAYRAEAEEWSRNYFDARDISLLNYDYLDTSDTFEAQRLVIYLDYGATEEDKPRENHTMTFVHYVNPKFSSVEDIKAYQVKYVFNNYDENGQNMNSWMLDRYFSMKVEPGQVIEDNWYNKYDYYPMFTEYNGKIYRCVYDDGRTQFGSDDQEMLNQALNRKWYVQNCNSDCFELIELGGGYESLGRWYSVQKVNGEWRVTESRGLGEVYSEDEIMRQYAEYKVN